MDTQSITTTDFSLPGQTNLYHGKVRDVYTLQDNFLVSIATDRISAFDVVLPRPIPYKGQVLNQIAAYFLEQTKDIVPNWLVATPDPNVSAGHKAEPFSIEMIIRGYLVGSAWRQYQSGIRTLCGVVLPEGMKEYDAFPEPIITPTTKAAEGHDEDITPEEIIEQGLATEAEWQQLADYTQQLFAKGQHMAEERGLLLIDTKYEFGVYQDEIIVIDEIHTPDSSRYFYKASYTDYVSGAAATLPRHLSKEFVREWLLQHGFSGQAGQAVPEMTDAFVGQVSERYIELYEEITGEQFIKADTTHLNQRIEGNITKYLEQRT